MWTCEWTKKVEFCYEKKTGKNLLFGACKIFSGCDCLWKSWNKWSSIEGEVVVQLISKKNIRFVNLKLGKKWKTGFFHCTSFRPAPVPVTSQPTRPQFVRASVRIQITRLWRRQRKKRRKWESECRQRSMNWQSAVAFRHIHPFGCCTPPKHGGTTAGKNIWLY